MWSLLTWHRNRSSEFLGTSVSLAWIWFIVEIKWANLWSDRFGLRFWYLHFNDSQQERDDPHTLGTEESIRKRHLKSVIRVNMSQGELALDLIDGWMFVTLYWRWWSKPSPRRRNAKRQNGCLRRPYKQLRKEKQKAKEKRKDIPISMQSSKEEQGEIRKPS